MRKALVFLLVVATASLASARRKPAELPPDPRDIPAEAQLSSTRSFADLDGNGSREVLILVNALTGHEAARSASEVFLAIAGEDAGGTRGELFWVRRLAEATGEPAHDGEITVVDLDGDGGSEIIVTWDRSLSADAVDRWAEIFAVDTLSRPRRVWDGQWEIDTRRDPATPAPERQWLQRDIDYGATRRQAGKAILLRTKQRVLGGEMLDKPKLTLERVDVRLRSYG